MPGILLYESVTEGEVFVALDEGVLIKAGQRIFISVRHALGGSGLDKLHQLVTQEFLNRSECEKNVRSVLAKRKSNFVRQFINFQQE
ncbi:F0F1 ATP synthase subunit epsilon [Pontibacter chitinilyticus]|uniref:F0F1 ATP synthase subunit epsilon n=1 Tax=Pontibacter chitinilyticus TaxID=2674989 RepID=UPI003219CED9